MLIGCSTTRIANKQRHSNSVLAHQLAPSAFDLLLELQLLHCVFIQLSIAIVQHSTGPPPSTTALSNRLPAGACILCPFHTSVCVVSSTVLVQQNRRCIASKNSGGIQLEMLASSLTTVFRVEFGANRVGNSCHCSSAFQFYRKRLFHEELSEENADFCAVLLVRGGWQTPAVPLFHA
jgi:hypothetical protein